MVKKLVRKPALLVFFSVLLIVALMMTGCKASLGSQDPEEIFINDPNYPKLQLNKKEIYKMQQWEKFGYVDYILYTEFLNEELSAGRITDEEMDAAKVLGATADKDSDTTAKMVEAFTQKYSQDYTIVRLDGVYKIGTRQFQDGGEPVLYAYKELSFTDKLLNALGIG